LCVFDQCIVDTSEEMVVPNKHINTLNFLHTIPSLC
jgi:hypothetical protein